MMAVEASDIDDDDGPVVFKRQSSASKKKLLNPETKKSSPPGNDRQAHPSNVKHPTAVKGKNVPSNKTFPVRSSAPLSKGSTSDVYRFSSKTSVANPKTSNSAGIEPKPLVKQTLNSTAMEENNSGKHPCIVNQDSDDSEDDKPLSAKLKTSSHNAFKANSSPKMELLVSPMSNSIIKGEGSDDEVPLSSRFSFKSTMGSSSIKDDDSYENKPLTSKIQKDALSSKEKQVKSNSLPVKRSLEKTSSEQSSIKKLKLSDASMSTKNKQENIRSEPKAMDGHDDDAPIVQRLKKVSTSENKAISAEKKITKVTTSKKVLKGNDNKFKKSGGDTGYSKSTKLSPSSGDGQKKWTTLVHNGVIFPPPYKPHGVKILYKNKAVGLTPEQEEVATMYAMMLDTDYMQKPKFKENFWNDWRKILGKNHVIQNLDDCDFRPVYDWYQQEKDKKKQMSSEEKKALKEEKAKQEEKYMWAVVDGVKEKVGNFRVEPPGLFRGRGDHPKMGKLKKRIHPSDIVINIGKDAPVPECPIAGESWKEVRHDNTVTWLAYWNDPINPKLFKYVFLGASSSLKGQSDKEKYEKARMLKDYIENIRAAYKRDFTNKDATKRQIAVATYLIDKLALRAGNEKDDEEAADTVGCCTLKVENVEPRPPNILHFDFLGKDSIRYEKDHEVDLLVYNAIISFRKGKGPAEPLFDQLDTTKLNTHLKELMPGLTAKVFRTYNASITLDKMLNEGALDGDVAQKIIVYQQANKEVAIICNHQRTVSKSHAAQMSKLSEKIEELEDVLKELKIDLDRARKGKPPSKSADGKRKKSLTPEVLEKKIAQTNAKIEKMQKNKETKEDLKEIALGTSKINYLDPRITVAWCKRQDVPIEKIFNKSLLAKFAWAMDVDPEFRF